MANDEDPPAVRRVGEDDWTRLREVRLAALADSPTAFASTLGHEREYREEDWREWTRRAAVFIAFHSGAPVGVAVGIDGETAGERQLVAMWVHPDHRRLGVAAALLAAVRRWALDQGATRLVLWVTRSNRAAARLYRRAGFAPTGESQPLPSNPALIEDQLVLDLR